MVNSFAEIFTWAKDRWAIASVISSEHQQNWLAEHQHQTTLAASAVSNFRKSIRVFRKHIMDCEKKADGVVKKPKLEHGESGSITKVLTYLHAHELIGKG